jgi:hypothetical protein
VLRDQIAARLKDSGIHKSRGNREQQRIERLRAAALNAELGLRPLG